MNVIDFGEAIHAGRPTPTPEQYAAEWTYLARNAPDLLDMVLGDGGDL